MPFAVVQVDGIQFLFVVLPDGSRRLVRQKFCEETFPAEVIGGFDGFGRISERLPDFVVFEKISGEKQPLEGFWQIKADGGTVFDELCDSSHLRTKGCAISNDERGGGGFALRQAFEDVRFAASGCAGKMLFVADL